MSGGDRGNVESRPQVGAGDGAAVVCGLRVGRLTGGGGHDVDLDIDDRDDNIDDDHHASHDDSTDHDVSVVADRGGPVGAGGDRAGLDPVRRR